MCTKLNLTQHHHCLPTNVENKHFIIVSDRSHKPTLPVKGRRSTVLTQLFCPRYSLRLYHVDVVLTRKQAYRPCGFWYHSPKFLYSFWNCNTSRLIVITLCLASMRTHEKMSRPIRRLVSGQRSITYQQPVEVLRESQPSEASVCAVSGKDFRNRWV